MPSHLTSTPSIMSYYAHLALAAGQLTFLPPSPNYAAGPLGDSLSPVYFARFCPKLAVDFDPHCLDVFEDTFKICFPPDSILDSHLASTQWLHRLVGVTVICAGIPCQPHSNLGNQKHEEDNRDLLQKNYGHRAFHKARSTCPRKCQDSIPAPPPCTTSGLWSQRQDISSTVTYVMPPPTYHSLEPDVGSLF